MLRVLNPLPNCGMRNVNSGIFNHQSFEPTTKSETENLKCPIAIVQGGRFSEHWDVETLDSPV